MMMEKLKALKGKSELPEMDRKAKSDVLTGMRDKAAKAMGEKLKGLKKVSVMSDSPEGLEEGLDKAQELLSKAPEGLEESADMASMEEAEEEHELVSDEDKALSAAELEQRIAALMELKAQKEELG